MTDDSSISEVLLGVSRLLDQRPDLRARVAIIEISRADGVALVPSVLPMTPVMAPSPTGYENVVRPEFNLAGHAVIAYVAEQYLENAEPDVYRALQAVKAADPLGRGDVGSFAMWPDQLKHPPKGQEQAFAEQAKRLGGNRGHWHYVNIPYDPKHKHVKPDPASASGDLLKQLPGQLDLIKSSDALAAADALCYVLHLVGDLHQPLHCAALADGEYFTTPPEYDQGGNLIHWGTDSKRAQNLHALWDDAIAASSSDVENRVQRTLSDYPHNTFSKKDIDADLTDIAVESFDLAKSAYDDFLAEASYQGPSQAQSGAQIFSSPSPTYRNHARDICRRRAALAGYRLARLLGEFLPAPGGGQPAAHKGHRHKPRH